MNKIICDICGTSYLETEESCPVCGCSRASAADFLNADVLEEDLSAEETVAVNSVKKEIFDLIKLMRFPLLMMTTRIMKMMTKMRMTRTMTMILPAATHSL